MHGFFNPGLASRGLNPFGGPWFVNINRDRAPLLNLLFINKDICSKPRPARYIQRLYAKNPSLELRT